MEFAAALGSGTFLAETLRTLPGAFCHAATASHHAHAGRNHHRHRLADTRLSERKLIERAKGVLMKARKLSEEDAYAALRRMAMERSVTIGEIAKRLLEVSDLLG